MLKDAPMGLKEKLLEVHNCADKLPQPEVIDLLIEIADENHSQVAQHAIGVLIQSFSLGKPLEEDTKVRIIRFLMSALMDKKRHANVRRACALGLGILGPKVQPEVQEMMLQSLSVALSHNDISNTSIINIVWAIGQLGKEACHIKMMLPLKEILQDSVSEDTHCDWAMEIIEESIVNIEGRIEERNQA